jgi:hypothetical protein
MRKVFGTIFTLLCIGVTITIGSAFVLNFSDIQSQALADKFSPIHFAAPGNNFIGGVFWITTKSLSGNVKITFWSEERSCNKQVRGIYFNSQRGKRVWPLDQYTLLLLQETDPLYNQLQITGGLYTSCTGSAYSIFWQISYDRSGGTTSEIVAGTTLQYNNNSLWTHFADSFQYFDNKSPIGYIWDSYGGIGFVGGSINGSEDLISYLNGGWTINEAFLQTGGNIASTTGSWTFTSNTTWDTASNIIRNLLVQGSVGLSQSMNMQDRASLLGNPQGKTVIIGTENINNATLINQAKQNREKLCKGKTRFTTTTLPTSNDSVLCFENTNLSINLLTDEPLYHNKTLVMKNGNILISNSMESNYAGLDMFIDQWNLYLENNPTNKQNFDSQWYAGGLPAINSWTLVRWNIIINGLLLGWTPTQETGYHHKLYVQGKISSLNTPFTPTPARIDFITDVLWSGYTHRIWLQNVFVRTCRLNGIGTDWSSCKDINQISSIPLVIVDGKYLSRLLSN